MSELKFPSANAIERLPWALRALLGCCAALMASVVTFSIEPLRAFPLLLAFPTVILSCWFLGMWGGVFCALTEAILVDSFLTRSEFRFSLGKAPEEMRLAVFLVISICLGLTIRRLAQQRSLLSNKELQQRLSLANAERQLAEERARASEATRDRDDLMQIALRANGMGLWVWDLKTGAVHWSDEVYQVAGLDPGSFKPGPEAWLALVLPEDRESVRGAYAEARSGRDYHEHYRVLCPDGSVRWIESRGKGQLGDDGSVVRVVGVISDVTHRKQADEAILRAEKLAVVGRLAASVAHEINNPLEAVTNLLYLITLAETLETARAQANLAMDELMRVSLITQQTLKFHRQAGTPKKVKLSDLIETVLGLFRGKLMGAQVVVEVRVKRESLVSCMTGETQQIFANLLSNAIEAMPEGGKLVIRIRPSRDWRSGGAEGMRVTICDSGVGMVRSTRLRIFEPFFTTKTETGTGLGMWVVSQLVERHGGEVRVWSSQRAGASGTAFSVFLPLGYASATDRLLAEAVSA